MTAAIVPAHSVPNTPATPADSKAAVGGDGSFGHVLSQEMNQHGIRNSAPPSNVVVPTGGTPKPGMPAISDSALLAVPPSLVIATSTAGLNGKPKSTTTDTRMPTKDKNTDSTATATAPQALTAEMLALANAAPVAANTQQPSAASQSDNGSAADGSPPSNIHATHSAWDNPMLALSVKSNATAASFAAANPSLTSSKTTQPTTHGKTDSSTRNNGVQSLALPDTGTVSNTAAKPEAGNAALLANPAVDGRLAAAAATAPQADVTALPNNTMALSPAALSAALSAPVSGQLAPQVGSPAWDQALSQHIVWMANGAEQSATLSLNPPDLGPLQIVLNVSNNQATATFIAAQPEVRQAIEAAMPRLEAMMFGAGIQLGQTNVRSDSSSQQNSNQPQSRKGSSTSSTLTALPVTGNLAEKRAGGQGLVNTFV